MHILTKRSLLLSFVMLVLFLLVIYCVFSTTTAHPTAFNLQNVDIIKPEPDKLLKLVHIVFRHGQRTPADTYPTDPHINETFTPFGWGQLTNTGKKDLYDTGKWLRARYNTFLGELYSPDIVHAQSTGVSRTKMSLQLVLAGLWPPRKTALDWNKELNWQPVTYDYESLDEDTLLLVRTSCPRYYEELHRIFKEEDEIIKLMEDNQQLFNEISNITGMEIITPDDLQSLYSTLKAEEDYGLKLPKWTKEYYPDKMLDIVEKSYVFNVYNDELKKLKGGPFVAKMLKEWNNMRLGKLKPNDRKMFIYTGHDSTVVNILSALNIWKQQIPAYGIMGIFELYEDLKTNVWGVKSYLQTTAESPATSLTIPGCDEFCPIDKLMELTKNIIPSNDGSDCRAEMSDFTEPPPRGP